MPAPRSLLPFAAGLLALAACAEETRPSRSLGAPSAAPAAAPAAAPSGPVTRHDGRWSGTLTLVPLASMPCPPAPAGNLDMTISQGRGTLLLNRQTRQTLAGSVAADDSLRFSDPLERTSALTGAFTGDRQFIGEYRSGRCTYNARFTKQ